MEKYKFLVYDPKNMNEPEQRESSVGNEIVKKMEELLKTVNNDTITISPIVINPNDLSVSWGVIETVYGKKTLTHYISIKKK